MRVLISTIVRNRGKHISSWANQLSWVVEHNPDIVFDLYVFENDSTDTTKQTLLAVEPLLKKKFNRVEIQITNLEWPYFHSVKAEQRVKYLAEARNKTLEAANTLFNLASYDKVACVEPDVTYHTAGIGKLFYSDLDIASGYSFLPEGMGVPDWIYDSWATRVNPEDSEYFGPRISELPECLPVASTFNCFCVYKAKPFIEGARFSGINPLTNTWDCDTTNICFEFAKRGYDKIGMYNTGVLHKP
jgi:hypothetical protein